ncbi:hypothetical protein ACF065_09400 [Streptomyces sp. NPDC015232]|uniref:hypothetical protein n=1 Tax=unclassified Streptomyces TaxID=2593676 RepID=UPI0036F5BD1F
MRHMGVFRWVTALGLTFLLVSFGLSMAAPDYPELIQVDLTVMDEKPDGTCRVRWSDPGDQRFRDGTYHCDPKRSALLKAPNWDGSGYGWDSGFVRAEEPHQGELFQLDQDLESDGLVAASDWLVVLGLLLVLVGLVGGNIRALPRLNDAEPRLLRRAAELREAAFRVTQDHERAVLAVRAAWEEGPRPLETARGTELLRALWVLVEAGPAAREAAATGRRLSGCLDLLLEDAAPAAGYRSVLRAGPESRRRAARAITELRPLLAAAERDGLTARFAQASVDLLRGQDPDPEGLTAWAGYRAAPEEYRRALSRATGSVPERSLPTRSATAALRLAARAAVPFLRLRPTRPGRAHVPRAADARGSSRGNGARRRWP